MNQVKYKLIKQELRDEINTGLFQPGQKFYSESELKHRYQVSSATIVRAIQELVNDEYIVRYQGKGTFVSKAKRNEKVIFSETDNQLSGTQKIKMMACTVECDPNILIKLNLKMPQQYYKIVRVRLNNKIPFAVQISYIAESYFKDKSIIERNPSQSIYDLLKQNNGLDMYSMPFIQSIDVLPAIPAELSDYLQLPTTTPIVSMIRHTFNQNKDVIEYIETYKTIDTFHIEIKNSEDL